MTRCRLPIILLALLALVAEVSLVGAQKDEEEGVAEFEGSVEVLYRNVDVNGSERSYNEDFDGLSSGGTVSNGYFNWRNIGLTGIDYARIEVLGLGNQPYQHIGFRFGATDTYDVQFNWRSQDYVYNLFGLYGDEDGSTWNTDRQISNLKFTYYVTPKANVFFEFRDNERSGSSLFMKDVERELFRLETPIDVNETRYSVGTTVNVGPVDVYFRQTLRDYENNFENTTEGNLGLDPTDLATLNSYDWRQRERSDGNLTELKIHSAIGKRVDLTFGTLVGDDDLTSRVNVNADGTSFTGFCAVGGGVCTNDATCDAVIAGDVCVAAPFTIVDGSSDTRTKVDYTVVDIDLSWTVIDPVILHLRYNDLDRNLSSTGDADLSGAGVPVNVNSTVDWNVEMVTFVVEAHPTPTLTFDIGYRFQDRTLDRNGFVGNRNADFQSDGDETLVAGLVWRPIDWFRLDVDYEDADVDQPFTNVSLFDSERSRIRTVFSPLDGDMKIELSYLDFENSNTASDFRPFNTFFGSSYEGTTWSGSWWYRPSEIVDFLVRFAEQEIDSAANVIFDTAGFGGTDSGVNIFDNTNKEAMFRVNLRWTDPWLFYLQYWITDSNGANPLIDSLGANVGCLSGGSGAVCSPLIDQEYSDAEVGLRYTFDSGIYVGGSYRDFDFDDINSVVDYDGTIVTVLAGVTF